MVFALKTLIRLTFLCILWVLTRGLQLVYELSELHREADWISNSELELQVKIQRHLKSLAPEFIRS